MPSEKIWVELHREVKITPLDCVKKDASPDNWRVVPIIETHPVHDDVDRSNLATFLRCLSFEDRDIRMQALRLFHEAQLARWNGGTMSHKIGYRLTEFLVYYERLVAAEGSK